jgi:hypothetical protein
MIIASMPLRSGRTTPIVIAQQAGTGTLITDPVVGELKAAIITTSERPTATRLRLTTVAASSADPDPASRPLPASGVAKRSLDVLLSSANSLVMMLV